jgi:hypothetical protein
VLPACLPARLSACLPVCRAIAAHTTWAATPGVSRPFPVILESVDID